MSIHNSSFINPEIEDKNKHELLQKINGLLEEGSPVHANFSRTSNVKFKIMENIEKKLNKNYQNIDIQTHTRSNLGHNNIATVNKETAGDMLDSYLTKLTKNKYVANNQSINEHTYSSNLKLEEMITLEVIKSSKLTGQTKKMLHVPSMKIFIIKVK